jgi:multidrug transporter EmrE-like cation transporter
MEPLPLFSFLYIVVLGAVGVLGDIFIKRAASSGHQVDLRFFAAGLGVYAATALGWLLVMKSVKLATIGPVYALSTTLLLTFAGVAIFGERLRPAEVAGLGFAVVAIALLSRFGGA